MRQGFVEHLSKNPLSPTEPYLEKMLLMIWSLWKLEVDLHLLRQKERAERQRDGRGYKVDIFLNDYAVVFKQMPLSLPGTIEISTDHFLKLSQSFMVFIFLRRHFYHGENFSCALKERSNHPQLNLFSIYYGMKVICSIPHSISEAHSHSHR